MTAGPAIPDPLELGQRIVAVLETGLRTATYKLATLMALVDQCVENLPSDPTGTLTVPIRDLAERVIELYWRQVTPLSEFGELRQSTQSRARIPSAVSRLRQQAAARRVSAAAAAKLVVPDAYSAAVDDIALTLAQQPIHRLQRIAGPYGVEPFLYDDSWLDDHVSVRTLRTRGYAIELMPGVAWGLARLAGLLKPTLEILWIQDVTRMNASLRDTESPDLAAHLFGHERVSLERVREAFLDSGVRGCFSCHSPLRPGSPVDHVLPWSRVGIDGLANLVLACQACNSAKANALPTVSLLDRAASRDNLILEAMGGELGWPVQRERTLKAARGLYLSSPAGSPTWAGRGKSLPLDLVLVPAWFRVESELERHGGGTPD